MRDEFPGYTYLGSHRWARREAIPAPLLSKYDRFFALAENNPSGIDPETGRAYGAVWLDAIDEISKHGTPLLDRAALLQDQDLRSRADHRALHAMLERRTTRP